MNPLLKMEEYKDQFTKNDFIIYNKILENPEKITYLSTSMFAELCNVSQPALSRFIKTIGYAKYQDFRSDITSWVAKQNVPKNSNRLYYFEKLQLALQETEKLLTDEYMKELASYVRGFGRIFATGKGKSNQPAILLQQLSRKEDIFVYTCDWDAMQEYADHFKPDDLLIVFSVSANSSMLKYLENTEARIILVSSKKPTIKLEHLDKLVLIPFVPPDPESSSVSPVLFNIFVELLVSYLFECKGV